MRTCETCAWHEDIDPEEFPGYEISVLCCFNAPTTEGFPAIKKTAWCRHWAATRGWPEDAEKPEQLKEDH